MRLSHLAFATALAVLGTPALAHDPGNDPYPATRDEMIALAKQVHGGFGSLIALGLRIGADAMKQLDAKPREFDITYFEGENSPCPCVIDGIIVATSSSPGQRAARVAPEPAGPGLMGRILMRHKPSGRVAEIEIPVHVGPGMRDINREPEIVRWNYVMHADRSEHYTLRILPASPSK